MHLSKKLRRAFTQTLIDLQPMGKPFSKGDLTAFNWLVGVDAANVVRVPNPEFPADTRHIKADGESLSWNRAIAGYDETQKLKKTMRRIIAPDLRDFLSAVDPCACETCGVTNDLTVDHAGLPFDDIASAFIDTYGPIEVEPKANGVGDKFTDIDLEAEWVAYHAANSEYQILCRSCNASKGKK